MSHARWHSRGFTLVELLIVLGLIALLISMLTPLFVTMRENANRTQCVANLFVIDRAAHQHAIDHRGYLPCAGWHIAPIGGVVNPQGLDDSQAIKYDYYTDGTERRPMPITAALSRYMGITVRTDSRASLQEDLLGEALRRQWRCPSQVLELSGWSQKESSGWTTPDEYSSYAFNEAILARHNPVTVQSTTGPSATRPTTRLATQPAVPYPVGEFGKIRQPAEVFLFLDGRTRDRTDRRICAVIDYTRNDTLYDYQKRSFSESLDYYRHRRLFNVLFLDGHVQTMSMEDANLRLIGVSKGVF